MSRPGAPVKLLGKNAHLSFVVARTSATCLVCHELKGRRDEPACERCGLGAFHFSCYTDAIARSPKEQAFWARNSGGQGRLHPAGCTPEPALLSAPSDREVMEVGGPRSNRLAMAIN
jgi:hypothetical protein